MYLNIGQGNALGLGDVGGFANLFYWSSTEYAAWYSAWSRDFTYGDQAFSLKNENLHVRAVRAF